MASPGLAKGVAIEDRALDATQVVLVDPSFAGGHDFIAVVEEEAVLVRMSEKIEIGHRAARQGIQAGKKFVAGIQPHQLGTALGGLLLNPSGVGFAVFATTGHVAGLVDHPDDIGVAFIGGW